MKKPFEKRQQQNYEADVAFVHAVAEQLRRQSKDATTGEDVRLRSIAAEFAHLGTITDQVLAAALYDLEIMPDYLSAVVRTGLEALIEPETTSEAQIVQGTAQPSSVNDSSGSELARTSDKGD